MGRQPPQDRGGFGATVPERMSLGRHCVDLERWWVQDPETGARKEGALLTCDGYRAVVGGQWIDYAGGTSTGAPIWAAIIACVNQARAEANGAQPGDPPAKRRPVGFVNPLLYAMVYAIHADADRARLRGEKPKYGQSPFRDITAGRTDITVRALGPELSTQSFNPADREIAGYEATDRWDPVSGLGVPRVARLCELLAGDQIPGVHR